MRVRKKKHGDERILSCSRLLIENPAVLTRDPSVVFSTQRPICLEIGCGKGDFSVGMAKQNPDVNFIAMEKVADVAVTALEKAAASEDERPDNLRFIIGDAKNLPSYFPPRSLERIYVNFCDPWPKSGHAKRRLTYRSFLEIYRNLLREDGMLIFKTDNEGLFDFSLEEFKNFGLDLIWQTRDLHAENNEIAKNNVMTEYERNFSSKGQNIFSAHVRFPAGLKPLKAESTVRSLVIKNRSYRSFDSSEKIKVGDLREMIDCARCTPSAINLQPLKYRICVDEDAKTLLSLTSWAGRIKDRKFPPEGHEPCAFIIICIDTELCKSKESALRDIGICAQTIMLRATEMGYGGCMLGAFDPDKVRESMKISGKYVPNLILALGKPDETVALEVAKDGEIGYYRDENDLHHVPKRSLKDILI